MGGGGGLGLRPLLNEITFMGGGLELRPLLNEATFMLGGGGGGVWELGHCPGGEVWE